MRQVANGGLALAAAAFAGPADPAPPAAAQATWYRIAAADGAVLGYASQETRQRPGGRETIGAQAILVENGGVTTRISERSVAVQDEAGRTVSISESSRVGGSWSRTEAKIGPGSAEIVRITPSDTRKAVVPLPAGIRFDGGAGLLRGWDATASPRLEFQNLNLGAMAVERVVIERAAPRPGDPDGSYSALRRRYEGQELRAVARLSVDRTGRLLAVTQPMFGTSVTIALSDRRTALRPHPPYKLLRNAMVRSPFRISPAALQGRIRYRFAFRDGIEFALPETGEQRTAQSPGASVVDVCAGCGPGLASDPSSLADALRATAWLQSDHPRLAAIARPVARLRLGNARKMELLVTKARPYLGRIDFAGHYSALETIDRRAGDCTEAAVLLAALGRAAGIPTRVANGLVYSREHYHGVSNAFMPHSWTLAWVDGAWRSFDLALESFDSSHVALTVGDGDARSVLAAAQLASLLEWKEMTEIRSRSGS